MAATGCVSTMDTMRTEAVPLELTFDESITHVQSAPTGKVAVYLSLPVGVGALAREILRHTPPGPLEIEQAIEIVEDAVMPARAQLPDALHLFSADPKLRRLAVEYSSAGTASAFPWLGIDAVEQLLTGWWRALKGGLHRKTACP